MHGPCQLACTRPAINRLRVRSPRDSLRAASEKRVRCSRRARAFVDAQPTTAQPCFRWSESIGQIDLRSGYRRVNHLIRSTSASAAALHATVMDKSLTCTLQTDPCTISAAHGRHEWRSAKSGVPAAVLRRAALVAVAPPAMRLTPAWHDVCCTAVSSRCILICNGDV